MKEIGLLADKHTATCFKLAGLKAVFSVNDPTQAEKKFSEIMEKSNLRILLVSEPILTKIQIATKSSEQQIPLIIPIPTMKSRGTPRVDFMADLIKRKTGIEVKL
jgi:vacuolar-type H+-ATPase subunit F/Vma7